MGACRGGKTGGILSPRAWVGSSSSQGGRREEEMKPLAFVAGLGLRMGGGIEGVLSVRGTHQPAWECVRESVGAGGAAGQAIHCSHKSRIIFPTSA